MHGVVEYGYARSQRLLTQLQQLPRTITMVWTAARHLTTVWIALLVVQGLLPLAIVYLTRSLVNQLLYAVRSSGNWVALRQTLVLAACMGAVMLTGQLLRSLAIWVRTAQSELVKDYLADLIQRKSVEVDLAFYDSSDFYDHLHRARTEATYRPSALIDSIGTILQSLITTIGLVAVLVPFGPFLPLALLASGLPILYVTLKAGQRRHVWTQKITSEDRRSWYYDALLTNGSAPPKCGCLAWRSISAKLTRNSDAN